MAHKGTVRFFGSGSDSNRYTVIFHGMVTPVGKDPQGNDMFAPTLPADCYTVWEIDGKVVRKSRGVFEPVGSGIIITLDDINEDYM